MEPHKDDGRGPETLSAGFERCADARDGEAGIPVAVIHVEAVGNRERFLSWRAGPRWT